MVLADRKAEICQQQIPTKYLAQVVARFKLELLNILRHCCVTPLQSPVQLTAAFTQYSLVSLRFGSKKRCSLLNIVGALVNESRSWRLNSSLQRGSFSWVLQVGLPRLDLFSPHDGDAGLQVIHQCLYFVWMAQMMANSNYPRGLADPGGT